jgi:hypothetical protein
MSDASAQKKPPERLCPRGAKDTDFSGSDWTLPRLPWSPILADGMH